MPIGLTNSKGCCHLQGLQRRPFSSRQESMSIVVAVEGLQKAYGSTRAVDGVSFTVDQGEVFGMVGPNGAGKTTTIECVEGLRRADALGPERPAVEAVLDRDPDGSDQTLDGTWQRSSRGRGLRRVTRSTCSRCDDRGVR